jgi:hypothetical protein
MFTASLNLEALQKSTGGGRNCAAEGCSEPVSQGTEYCPAHSKQRAKKPRRQAKKSRR